MKVCFETKVADMPIKLEQYGKGLFRVTYWKQVKRGLTYSQAASELGASIMHASACEGLIDCEAEARE